jgi:flagellar capping protein FliD
LLPSEEITDLAEGTYTFTLTVGDTTHSLDVKINKTGLDPDTNKDVLKRLGRRISQADDSLEAFVVEFPRKVYSMLSDNLTEKVVYLTVGNKNTGDLTHFSLEDDSGTIIDTLGIDHLVQAGQPAQYRLNSFLSGAEGNTAVTDNGKLTFEFSDTTRDPVTVTVKAGLSPVREKIVDLLIAFNGYLSWLNENSSYFKPSLKTGILEEMDSTRRTLESIGLRYDENGMIYATDKFDDTLLTDRARIRDALTGEDGFFSLMSQKLDEIMDNGIQKYATSPKQTGIDILV